MVKKQSGSAHRGRAEEGLRTRARMIEAALQTLIEDGYAGTSTRAIAARGTFNPALIFYHYGSVDELLLAALDRSSGERLERYRAAMSGPGTPVELVRRAADLFREDVDSGHVTAVTELIVASLSRPRLRAELVVRMRPWLEFTQQALERALADSPLGSLVPAPEPAAFAIVSGYLGLHMMSRLMPDLSQTERLFALLEQLSSIASDG